jgi:hypothetical protein
MGATVRLQSAAVLASAGLKLGHGNIHAKREPFPGRWAFWWDRRCTVNGHVRSAERESGNAPWHDVDVRFGRQARPSGGAGRLERKRKSAGDPIVPRDGRFASDHVSVHDLDGAGDLLGQIAVLRLGHVLRKKDR